MSLLGIAFHLLSWLASHFQYLLILIGLLNISDFILCGVDKQRAEKGLWRVSEFRLLLIGFFGGCFGLLAGMFVFRHKTRQTKFLICAPLFCLAWGIVLVHVVSALTWDKSIEYRRITYTSEKIPLSLDGYTIGFVTDTHALPTEELQAVANKLNTYQLDLLLLGGDFPSQNGEPDKSMEILSSVQTADGIYGVEGNHDNYRRLFTAMEKYGITPLSNSGVSVCDGLFVCGVEDLWNRDPNVKKAAAGAKSDDFVLLLAHGADIAMKQETKSVDLILSGHSHGGQLNFFGIWSPALSKAFGITEYGTRFKAGWAKSLDGVDVYVSRGAGTFTNIPRVFARPEVTLLTLRPVGSG
jgi:predicted MPP superfamily phosphohydrolase